MENFGVMVIYWAFGPTPLNDFGTAHRFDNLTSQPSNFIIFCHYRWQISGESTRPLTQLKATNIILSANEETYKLANIYQ